MPPESWIPQAEIQGLRDRTRLRKALAEDRRGWGQRLHAYPARPRNWGKTTTAGTTTSTGHTARFASYHPADATRRRVPRLQAFVVAISSAGSSTNTTPPEFANLRANRQLERKSVARDERRHEGGGPGLERLGYALSKDRVQRGAEQPGARIGVRFPQVEDQLAYGSPAEHFVRFLGSKPERVSFSGGQGGHRFSLLEAYSY
jgi:hypothetical protein